MNFWHSEPVSFDGFIISDSREKMHEIVREGEI